MSPSIDWSADPLDVDAAHAHLAHAEHLATWPITEFDTTETHCYRAGDRIWIWQPDVGAARVSLERPQLTAWTWPDGDRERFRQVVTRSWLPAICTLWGRQVLHASAVLFDHVDGGVVGFTGPTHAGKSTLAFGLARHAGWQLLADDTLVFSIAASPDRQVARRSTSRVPLHPLAQRARLRAPSAEYFGVAESESDLPWPACSPELRAVYVLDPAGDRGPVADITPLGAAEALPLLLQQAYALSFGMPAQNQALMKDYVVLAATVPAFRLRYRRSFDAAGELFASVEQHVRTRLSSERLRRSASEQDAMNHEFANGYLALDSGRARSRPGGNRTC